MDILVIGDSHAKVGISNRRFSWLGHYIVDTHPDVVVDMGDFSDMPSLSSYDGSLLTGTTRPKASFNGKNYRNDIAVGVDARDRVHTILQRAGRKRPRRVALGGNHDDERILRALENAPELEGTISISDHQREAYGWESVGFLEPIEIGGFVFQHYFESGLMGKPVGGEFPAASLLKKQFYSCVAGHSHLFDESHRKTANRGKVQAFVAGCFLDPLQLEGYAKGANFMWDKGLLRLIDVEKGMCRGGFEWIDISRLQKAYSR
jgi:hypothetical protein